MTRNSDIEVNTLTSSYAHMAGLESLRQQQREQTLEWVSLNALSALRSTWHKAKLVNRGAPDSATLAEKPSSGRS
jgi:hypothetical protein